MFVRHRYFLCAHSLNNQNSILLLVVASLFVLSWAFGLGDITNGDEVLNPTQLAKYSSVIWPQRSSNSSLVAISPNTSKGWSVSFLPMILACLRRRHKLLKLTARSSLTVFLRYPKRCILLYGASAFRTHLPTRHSSKSVIYSKDTIRYRLPQQQHPSPSETVSRNLRSASSISAIV